MLVFDGFSTVGILIYETFKNRLSGIIIYTICWLFKSVSSHTRESFLACVTDAPCYYNYKMSNMTYILARGCDPGGWYVRTEFVLPKALVERRSNLRSHPKTKLTVSVKRHFTSMLVINFAVDWKKINAFVVPTKAISSSIFKPENVGVAAHVIV
jgi:hypothetical protein